MNLVDPDGWSVESSDDWPPDWWEDFKSIFSTMDGHQMVEDANSIAASGGVTNRRSEQAADRIDAQMRSVEMTMAAAEGTAQILEEVHPSGMEAMLLAKLANGDFEGAKEYAKENSTYLALGLFPFVPGNKIGFKSLSRLGLKDGAKLKTSKVLVLAEQFLGKGYKEVKKGSGRYISKDGTRVFRMGINDITGKHGGGPHVNFETLIPNPKKPGKMMVDKNYHIYLTD